MLCAAIGFGSLLYPAASAWFTARNHHDQITDYFTIVENANQEELNDQLNAAAAYNDKLTNGDLVSRTDWRRDTEYLSLLTVPGKAMIGQVSIARLNLELPIYHGTSDEVLSRGAGHLYGTSLPIGGPSTHTALTAHSGMSSGVGFDSLHRAKIDDLIEVRVLGQIASYRVADISVVEPTDTDNLKIIDGEDLITLVTCTPIGINSHRLLVTGRRVATTPESVQMAAQKPTQQPPWWLFIWLFAIAGTGWLTAILLRGKKGRHAL